MSNRRYFSRSQRDQIFFDSKGKCQKCGTKISYKGFQADHIIPHSKGGKTEWKNVVTACRSCNTAKGNKSLKRFGTRLLREPKTPSNFELKEIGRLYPPNYLHEGWNDFLYWDSELESE